MAKAKGNPKSTGFDKGKGKKPTGGPYKVKKHPRREQGHYRRVNKAAPDHLKPTPTILGIEEHIKAIQEAAHDPWDECEKPIEAERFDPNLPPPGVRIHTVWDTILISTTTWVVLSLVAWTFWRACAT